MTLRGAIVLGASRSGTSLATGLLVAAGFHAGAGSELMPANSGNPAGYWENLGVWRANEELLAALDGTWFAPPSRDAQMVIGRQATGRLRALLAQMCERAGERPIVVKDPRIGALLEIWGPLITDLLHPVLAVRHPLEIALSLEARDGTPTAFAQASWEVHTRRLLGYLNGRTVTVVRYGDLLEDTSAATAFVSATVGALGPRQRGHVDVPGLGDVIRSELRHQHAEPLDDADCLTLRQAELWHFLKSVPAGTRSLDVPQALLRAGGGAQGQPGNAERLLRAEQNRLRLAQAQLAELEDYARNLETLTAELEDRAERAEGLAASANERLGSRGGLEKLARHGAASSHGTDGPEDRASNDRGAAGATA